MKTSKSNLGAVSALAVSVCTFVAGCSVLDRIPSVGPDYEEPTFMEPSEPMPDAGYPTTNKTATGEFAPAELEVDPRLLLTEKDLADWWKNFDDPVLTGLVETALTNNLSFLMAQERLEQARMQLWGSQADFFPHLSLGGGASMNEHGKATPTGASARRAVHNDYFHGGFDATWEIDIFGGTRRMREAAYAKWEGAGCSLAAMRVSLTAEIGAAYINLRTTQQRLEVARANLKLQSETYDILKSRLDSGIGDELAVNQAKYNVEQTRAGIPLLLDDEESLMNALAILTGALPGSLHATLRELPPRDWLIAPRRLDSIPLDAMRLRPDVKAAERALAAQVASVGIAVSMMYPRFFINGSLGLESNNWDDFLHRRALVGSIGPSVSWPLFQGGNIYANIKAEESKMNEALLAYEAALQTAYGEVRNAYSAYTQQYHRFQSLQGAVKAAQDAEAISQDLYKNGLKDFNNVLDAQRSLLTLEEALTVSRGEISLHLVALYKALGGGLARN